MKDKTERQPQQSEQKNKQEKELHYVAPFILKKRHLILPIICTTLLYLAYLHSTPMVLFTLTIYFIAYLNRRQIYKSLYYKKLSLWFMYRDIKKMSKNINQTQMLLAKNLLNIPIKEGETEVKSFLDLIENFGKKYPFMNMIKDTRNEKIWVEGTPMKCISSYSYLSLTEDERVQNFALEQAKKYSTGNHGPRMLCGNLVILEDLEKDLARFFNREAALVFSSGYLACMSAIAGIASKNDFIIMDKLCHASLKAGVRLSAAGSAHYFGHNNFEEAESIIKRKRKSGQRLIMIIEGVYSMDGDIGNLEKARIICDKYGGTLIVDEAHSLGTIGKTGHGTEEHFNYKYRADIICGTFSKSLASVGGYIVCDKDLRTFYTLYAPGLVFSAPLSAYNTAAAMKALQILEQEPEKTAKLQENSKYLRDRFKENGFNIGHSVTCVIPVIFNDPIQTMDLHYFMKQKGFFSAAVMAPACPILEPRFRITPNCTQKKEDLDDIINVFVAARNACLPHPAFKELKDVLGL